MRENMKKILVTGGAGFIGSHLIESLCKNRDVKVTSIDNYSSGRIESHIEGADYLEGDIQQINELVNFRPDLVYHLGEYSRVEQSFFEVEKVWASNSVGTFEVLQFCRKHSCKLVYAGSSTKFGDGGLGRTQTPYGWTKAANTELVKCFGDWFNLDYAVTYFYNVFGGREIRTGKYATLIGIFTEHAANGKPLPVVMPGNQRRNFTHVDDIISGLMKVGEKGKGDDFGIGNENSFSIMEVAKMFECEIQELPPRRGNRQKSEIDTSKTRALGWSCSVQLEDYVEELRNSNWKIR